MLQMVNKLLLEFDRSKSQCNLEPQNFCRNYAGRGKKKFCFE
jgi:hypothetical protein